MAGIVKINGQDTYQTKGMILLKGSYQELEKPFGAWPEDARQIGLPVAVLGNGEVDFWTKYKGLIALLSSGSDIILEVQNLHRRFKLSYSSVGSLEFLSKVSGVGRMGAKMTINFLDDYPGLFTSVRSEVFTPVNGLNAVAYSRTYTSYSQADANALQAEDTTFLTDGQNYANLISAVKQ